MAFFDGRENPHFWQKRPEVGHPRIQDPTQAKGGLEWGTREKKRKSRFLGRRRFRSGSVGMTKSVGLPLLVWDDQELTGLSQRLGRNDNRVHRIW